VLASIPKKELSGKTRATYMGTVDCLAIVRDTTAINALGDLVMAYTPYMLDVKIQAVKALGSIGGKDALGQLARAIGIPTSQPHSSEISEAALTALRVHPEAATLLIEARPDSESSIQQAIDNTLAQMGETAAVALVNVIGQKDWAADILVQIGAPAVPAVTKVLDQADDSVRSRALGVLLTLYAKDKTVAASSLVRPELVPLLVQALVTSAYDSSQQETIKAVLVEIGEPAVAPLIAVLGQMEWADDLLARFGATAANQLASTLESDDVALRYKALSALLFFYQSDENGAAPSLVLTERVPLLVEARSKAGFGSQHNKTIEDILVKIGIQAAKVLAGEIGEADWVNDALWLRFGASAATQVAPALKSKDAAVRYQALGALLSFYDVDDKAVAPLLVQPELAQILIDARCKAGFEETRNATLEDLLVKIGKPALTALVTKGALLLTDDAQWTDAEEARIVYDLIKRYDAAIATSALVDRVTKDAANRLHVLFLAVKLGISGSEESLIDALDAHGKKAMGEDYLNSGSAKLREGAIAWGNRHGYYVSSIGAGSHRVSWGTF
jgi:hypothetical protein